MKRGEVSKTARLKEFPGGFLNKAINGFAYQIFRRFGNRRWQRAP
jgi:hypothetical protein